jgi:predicted alpha/beta hydrolase
MRVETADGEFIECVVAGEDNVGVVVAIAPAMGVRAGFYTAVATALAAQGATAVTFDLRGNGGHSVRRTDGRDWGYEEMVVNDFDAVVVRLRQRFAGRRIIVLGHSLGGQLACLYAARFPGQLDGLILVASCMVDWRGWRGLRGFQRLLQYFNIAMITSLLGYFPGERLGFAGNEPRGQMRDWVASAFTGKYRPRGAAVDYEAALATVSIPVFALTFAADPYAPASACEKLLAKMPNAEVRHEDVGERGVRTSVAAHFNWAKTQGVGDLMTEPLVMPLVQRWLAESFTPS